MCRVCVCGRGCAHRLVLSFFVTLGLLDAADTTETSDVLVHNTLDATTKLYTNPIVPALR